ncbi:MAG: tRNA (guanosine(46)-N7)-methyltransferase TrmB [Erysipelothrix sp.]|nr:tRNA (guanosine(46)-N7)-methyltransferase TrmB [Erysipelothrix sp.]
MRLRKKKWSDEVFNTHSAILVEDFKVIKGNWKNQLNVNKLRLEIGSGKGDYWHGLGQMYPNDGIIAVEKDYTASAIALRKLEEHGNKRFIYGDAKHLEDIFEKGELDVIHLNFSDPWPKTRHEKRRLTYDSKVKKYYDLLNDSGEIWMKTDNQGLFEYSLVNVSRFNFELIEVSVDFRKDYDEENIIDPLTEYERKFMGKGQPIYRAIWRKIDVK